MSETNYNFLNPVTFLAHARRSEANITGVLTQATPVKWLQEEKAAFLPPPATPETSSSLRWRAGSAGISRGLRASKLISFANNL